MEEEKLHGYALILIWLLALLMAGVLVSFMLGRFPISPRELASVLAERISDLMAYVFPNASSYRDITITDQMRAIFLNVRLPRILLACMVGCCLSAAGASYQGVFQNPMAAPDILGASSGAATGAALAILLEMPGRMVVFFAFAASLATIALVMLISRTARGNRLLRIILAGIMISSLCNAATSFIKLVADPNDILPEITYWMMGSLANKVKPSEILYTAIPMAIGLIPLLLVRWRINLLTLSEGEAKTMGVNVGRMRIMVILCATLVTAASVSVSGLIGWVGLVVPHLARRLVGNNYRYLLPVSMVGGSIFLLIVDNVSRNLLLTEIPIGILTSVVGAPFFIWMITRRRETV